MGRIRRPARLAAAPTLAIAFVVVVAACATNTRSDAGRAAPTGTGPGGLPRFTDAGPGAGWDCPGGSCDWTESPRPVRRRARAGANEPAGPASGGASVPSAGRGDVAESPPAGRGGGTAGSGSMIVIDDNMSFDSYRSYVDQFSSEHPDAAVEAVPLENRTLVRVLDPAGTPVLGALVEVSDAAGSSVATLRTFADGRAVFFPERRGRFRVVVSAGLARAVGELDPERRDLEMTLPVKADDSPTELDVMFLIDATASMAEELAEVAAAIDRITSDLSATRTAPRFGMTLYRDEGDLFRTRTFDLTPDVSAFRAALALVRAGGGGDTPEDLTAGLHDVLEKPSWRSEATVKVVVVVGDAAPHTGGESRYTQEVARAQALGVKLIPIGAPGVDGTGSFVFRQLAQQTLGSFLSLDGSLAAARPGIEERVGGLIDAELQGRH